VIATDDLVGAIWLPDDRPRRPDRPDPGAGQGRAANGGARIVEKVRVTEVLTRDGAAVGVRTDAGDVEAEVVVNCAGQWAKQVGAMAGVNVPLHSASTSTWSPRRSPGSSPACRSCRDPDGYTYFKEETGGLVVGGFEPEASRGSPPMRSRTRSSSSCSRRTGNTSRS